MLEKDKKKIVKSELIAMMENGMTRPEIAEHYGIPATQLKRAISQLGLTGTRAKSVPFIVEDDTVAANQTAIPFTARSFEGAAANVERIAVALDVAEPTAPISATWNLLGDATESTPVVVEVSREAAESHGAELAEDSLF